MSEPEIPPQFAAYPRGQSSMSYGSADRLQSLFDGFNGLSIAFGVNIALAIVVNVAMKGAQVSLTDFSLAGAILGLLGIVFVLVFFITLGPNKKIAIGKSWSSGYAYLASALMALNSVLCCGIIGYVVMQQIAANEIYKYGIRKHWNGFKKPDVQAMIAQLRAAEAGPIAPPPQI